MRQQNDYMPFVEMDAAEIESLFADVKTLVAGISEYIEKHS